MLKIDIKLMLRIFNFMHKLDFLALSTQHLWDLSSLYLKKVIIPNYQSNDYYYIFDYHVIFLD
jgi:hypothetical protein